MAFQVSPGVQVSEIDLDKCCSSSIQSTTGGFAGSFNGALLMK
jgi:hypothetical protein